MVLIDAEGKMASFNYTHTRARTHKHRHLQNLPYGKEQLKSWRRFVVHKIHVEIEVYIRVSHVDRFRTGHHFKRL